MRRAKDGLVKYKFKRDGTPLEHPVTGEPYYELEYSDTLLIFLLKAARPHKFRDNAKAVPEDAEAGARRLKDALDRIEETDGE